MTMQIRNNKGSLAIRERIDAFTLQPGTPPVTLAWKTHFTTRIGSPTNTYDCPYCKHYGIQHEVQSFAHGQTDGRSCWGAGIPTTIMVCTACGRWSGPWVSAEHVGGGW